MPINYAPIHAMSRQLSDRLEDFVSVKDFGAKGDLVADDSTAIQDAIDFTEGRGGGSVFFPYGNYKVNTTVNISLATGGTVRLVGEGGGASNLWHTDGDGKAILKSTGMRHRIEGLGLYKQGFIDSDATEGILTVEGCSQFVGSDLDINGGGTPVLLRDTAARTCTDIILDRCVIQNGTSSHFVRAEAPNGNLTGAIFIRRCLLNQSYPVQTPAPANFKGAWAANTAYSVGDVAKVGNYFVQCKTAGTSGGTVPTLAFYNTDIDDGSAVWLLMARMGLAALHFGTGVSKSGAYLCDATGPFQTSYLINNHLSGKAPEENTFGNCNADGPIDQGMFIAAGTLNRSDGFRLIEGTGPNIRRGILVSADRTTITGSGIRLMDEGIHVGTGATKTIVVGNHCENNGVNYVGNGSGTVLAANIF